MKTIIKFFSIFKETKYKTMILAEGYRLNTDIKDYQETNINNKYPKPIPPEVLEALNK